MRQLQGLQSSFNSLIAKFGEHSLVIEIASAIRSTMNDPEQARIVALGELWEGMAQEINIINALRNAAISKDDIDSWTKKLGTEFSFKKPETINYDNEILCWSLSGTKS